MKDKVFIDTNIFVYFLIDDEKHAEKSQELRKIIKFLLNKEIIISVQVLNELYAVLSKYKIPEDLIRQKLEFIILKTAISQTNIETIRKAWHIKLQYKYSYWDSLIVSSALQENCQLLLTEDLQNNQTIESSLKIVDPFKL
jgi:predicted nucleic acid-binding protein